MEQMNQILQPFSVDPCPCGSSLDNVGNVCPRCRWEAFYDSLYPRIRRSVDAYEASIRDQVRASRADRLMLAERFRFIANEATNLLLDSNPAGIDRLRTPTSRLDLIDEVKAVVDYRLSGQLEALKNEQSRRQTLNEAIAVLAIACQQPPARQLDEEAREAYLNEVQDAFEASLIPETE